MLYEKQLAFHITTRCTLNCAYCGTLMPEFKKRGLSKHIALEQIKEEIRAVFEIYDFIEDVTISGGEPLMHPELDEIINYCLSFRKQYKNLRIFTNGTIVPKDSLVDLIVENRNTLSLVIDDYGPTLSKQVTKIVNIMEQYGIHVRVNCYHGNEQHCGGWIDYGSPSTYRNYSAEYVQSMYQNCHVAQYRCIGVFNGKMTNCCWAVFGNELGYMPLPSGENQLINLLDCSVSIEKKKEIASNFGKNPLWACQYCNGFDVENSKRYPAGVQV